MMSRMEGNQVQRECTVDQLGSTAAKYEIPRERNLDISQIDVGN